MKKFILFFFTLVASVCAFAQGTADFNTLEPNSSYKTYTTTAGWVIENGCVQGGASDPDNASNPHFTLFGDSDGAVAAVINGKTTAVGKITSPVLEGGCGTLSLNYAFMFDEKNGVSFHVAILQDGAAVAEYDVVDKDLQKATTGSWSQKVAVPGNFQIVITNNCPTQSTSNKDRWSIWNLSWTAQAPLPVNPVAATITAVFPNGNKHVVYSNGEKLTAGAEVPADAISQFDVVSRTENTLVLKAGDQYIHWTSGDDKNKSSDLDGLNEEFDETLNTLTLAPATLQGCSTSAEWGKTEADVEGLYRLQGMGTNGQLFDFTLREFDDAWIAGNSGNIFFDTNWDGNGCRTSFFEIVVEEVNTEVDFEKVNVAAIKQADFVEEGKWYLLKQKRGPSNTVLVTPVHDEGVGATMKRAAKDEVVVEGTDGLDAVDYLLRFIPTENEGAYNIQFANGHYWASTMTTTEEEPGEYNVYNINGEATHIGINLYNMDKIVDNNAAGGTLAFWESGEVTKLDGNNDWTVWEVEFAPKSQATAELKALVTEYEAAYAANNAAEVGEGIITSTDQFSSPHSAGSEEPNSSLANLLDMDGSTYWHSSWANKVDNHVHYLQVEFAEPISGAFELNMNRRVNGTSLCANDNPVKMSVETSLDGEEFVLADEFDTPFTQTAAAPLVQATVNIPAPAKYLRFFNDGSNGGNDRGYWHCGDLQLKPIVTPAPNAAHAEAAAAFAEALAAAKAAGANATDADVAALQAAYETYVAALAAPVDPIDPVEPEVTFPVEGKAYVVSNNDASLYLNIVADDTRAALLTAEPEKIFFVKKGEGWLIKDEEGNMIGGHAKNWNISNTIEQVWNVVEVEGGYAFQRADAPSQYLGFDKIEINPDDAFATAGFRDKNYATAHGVFTIVEYTFPLQHTAYKVKNIDSGLYMNITSADSKNVTIEKTPQEIFFTAAEDGGFYIQNKEGAYIGAGANDWTVANAAATWNVVEVEGGYAFQRTDATNKYLGLDSVQEGSAYWRDKGAANHYAHLIMLFSTPETTPQEDLQAAIDAAKEVTAEAYANVPADLFEDLASYVDEAKALLADQNTALSDILAEIDVLNAAIAAIQNYTEPSADALYTQLVASLAEAKAILEANGVAYDLEAGVDYTNSKAGLPGYKAEALVKKVGEMVEYYDAAVAMLDDMEAAGALEGMSKGEAFAMMLSYGEFAASTRDHVVAVQHAVRDYNNALPCIPEVGKTYLIRNHTAGVGNGQGYSYVMTAGEEGLELVSYTKIGEIENKHLWTVSEHEFKVEDDWGDLLFSETRYVFTNVATGQIFGYDNGKIGLSDKETDMNCWYFAQKTPKEIFAGSKEFPYGTLGLQYNDGGNKYRYTTVDMRVSDLSISGGDMPMHGLWSTYSSAYIFEVYEPIFWDGSEPVVAVTDDATVNVTFENAGSVEASAFGVLAAIYDEKGEAYGIAFNDLFPETVEFNGNCATINFKKLSELNSGVAESAKALSSKVKAAIGGEDVKGQVVICGKSFVIDGTTLYDKVIVADYVLNGGNVTGLDTITLGGNVKVYDLQGRRIATPAKGLSIQNGVKVVR